MNETAIKNDITFLREEVLKGFSSIDGRFEKFSTLMMDGFAHLNTKFDTRIDDLDKRLGRRIDDLDGKLSKRIDELEERLDKKIDSVEERLDRKIDSLETKIDYRFDALSDGVSYAEFRALEGRVITLENVPKTA